MQVAVYNPVKLFRHKLYIPLIIIKINKNIISGAEKTTPIQYGNKKLHKNRIFLKFKVKKLKNFNNRLLITKLNGLKRNDISKKSS